MGQYVGIRIDLHRRSSTIYRMAEDADPGSVSRAGSPSHAPLFPANRRRIASEERRWGMRDGRRLLSP